MILRDNTNRRGFTEKVGRTVRYARYDHNTTSTSLVKRLQVDDWVTFI